MRFFKNHLIHTTNSREAKEIEVEAQDGKCLEECTEPSVSEPELDFTYSGEEQMDCSREHSSINENETASQLSEEFLNAAPEIG